MILRIIYEIRLLDSTYKIRWLDTITDSIDMNLSKLWEIVEDREAWRVAVHGIPKGQTQLSDWTTT